MQASFTELVGTAMVPAHCFDSTELTDLTPSLDTAAHHMAHQASETVVSLPVAGCVQDMALQASAAFPTGSALCAFA